MDVQCALCDIEETIERHSYVARRLRTQRNHAYLCSTCYDRIKENTEKRLATGKFLINKGC